jgi:hypothetical protein
MRICVVHAIIGIVLASFSSGAVAAAGWPQTYNGPDMQDDAAIAITSDGAGALYVLGYSQNSTAGYGFLLIKYTSTGTELWQARYDTAGSAVDLPAAMVLDSKTNIVIVGRADGANFVTVKFDRNGNKLWDATFRGTNGGYNWASSVGVDATDNIFVGGSSERVATVAWRDLVVLKYGANGVSLWTNRYTLAETNLDACCIAVESNGNVSITGEISSAGGSRRNWATVKYDALGNQLWARVFNGGVNGIHSPAAMIADTSGNTYVTGRHQALDGSGANFATVKYDGAGNVLWTAFFNGGANSDDGANVIALDDTGNVLVAGYTGNVRPDGYITATNWTVVKYNAAGQQLWSASHARNYFDRDLAVASLKVDAAGNTYIAGGAYADFANDFPVWKLDVNGNRVWSTNEILGLGIQSIPVRALVPGTGGVVYATGYRRAIAAGNPNDFFTARYTTFSSAGLPIITNSPQGSNVLAGATVFMSVGTTGAAPFTFQWRRNGTVLSGATNSSLLLANVQPANAGDYSVAISNAVGAVVSVDARVWVLAITNQPRSASAVPGATISFGVSAAGAPLGYRWRFNGADISSANQSVLTLTGVVATNTGDYDVVVTNWFGALTSQVARLTVYGQVEQEWTVYTNVLNDPPGLASLIRVVATDKPGNVYVAGLDLGPAGYSMELVRYSDAGAEIWRRSYRGPLTFARAYATALTLDSAENIIVTGIATAPTLGPPLYPPQTGYSYYQTFKYSPAGVQQFSSSINAPFGTSDPPPPVLAADAFGNAFIAARTLVAKLATNGQSLWVSNHALLSSPVLAADSAGDILLAASITGTNGTSDYVTIKRSSSGVILWSQAYDGLGRGADIATAITLDLQGNAIVSGTSAGSGTDTDIVTLKYAPDGTQLWSVGFDGSAHGQDEGVAVKADSRGDIFVAGKTTGTNGTKDFVLIKHNGSNGAPIWVRQYDGPGLATDDLQSMVLDSVGNICFAGTSSSSVQSGFKTIEYDSDGHLLWEAFMPLPGQIGVTGLATHGTDAVYLVGYYHPAFSIVRPLLKYSIDYSPIGGRFTHYRSLPSQQAEISFTTIAGNNYALESTAGPLPTTNWIEIGNIVRTTGQMQFVVPTTNGAAQFYRLRFDP